MSEENVEIVRSIYEALNRGDWDAATRPTDPDFEVTFQRGPNAGTHRSEAKRAMIQADIKDTKKAPQEARLQTCLPIAALDEKRTRSGQRLAQNGLGVVCVGSLCPVADVPPRHVPGVCST